jgi:predicted enzyme related to lactoylglutathione lyase
MPNAPTDAPRNGLPLLVNIDVDDLAQAERFYCAAFDLHPGRRFGADGVELLGSSAPIYLLVKAAGTPAAPTLTQPRDYGRHWTPTHLDFVVEDIEAAVQQAERVGARLEHAIATQRWGRLAPMADPFGHGFCFVQFLGAGYDAIADDAASPPT